MWWAKGGTNQLINGMVTHFQRLGGEVRMGDPVTHVSTLGARVTGVETKRGWSGQFDAVASNADIMHSYRDLMPDNQHAKRRAKSLAKKRYSPSLFVVHFGVE